MLDGDKKSIIERAISGEASAFGLLYDEYNERIYRFIYLKVSHREEAEDLAHQVFLSAWQNIKNYKFQGVPFHSWLYQIARNQVIDHYRTKKPTVNIELVSETISYSELLDEDFDANSELGTIKKAISKLNQEQQDIIIMRFIEDIPPKEIASVLKKPESTVRVLQHRAVKNLKKILNQNQSANKRK